MSELFPNEIDILSRIFAREQDGHFAADEEHFSAEELRIIERLAGQSFLDYEEVRYCPSTKGGYVPQFEGLRLQLAARKIILDVASVMLHPSGLFPFEIVLLDRVLQGETLLDAPEELFSDGELVELERLNKKGFVEYDEIISCPSQSYGWVPHFRGLRLTLAGRRVIKNKGDRISASTPIAMREQLFNISGNAAKSYDFFISHAWEDKDEVARPLANALADLGYRVWYDETTLKLGDSLRAAIDRGLSASTYGVVVLSKSFFAKSWPQYELDGLIARESSDGKVILPLWHRLNKDQVTAYSPILAGRLAAQTALKSITDIAAEIQEAIS